MAVCLEKLDEFSNVIKTVKLKQVDTYTHTDGTFVMVNELGACVMYPKDPLGMREVRFGEKYFTKKGHRYRVTKSNI